MDEPQLGHVTNEQMIRELIRRFELDGAMGHPKSLMSIRRATLLSEMLGSMSTVQRDNRTVDSDY